MSDFMQPQAILDDFVEFEVDGETFLVPSEIENILPDGAVIVDRHEDKWFVRLSAPGYLDCTDWDGPFDTEKEAMDHLIDLYDLDTEEG